MKITWLGQAGLLLETNGITVIIDPYLSNSVEEINPKNFRRVPVDDSFLKIKPDIIVCTHNHLDHTDPETLKHYLSEQSLVTVLASKNAWNVVRKFGGDNNYVLFNRHTVWNQNNLCFTAVKAEHSDDYAVGVIIVAENKRYYITGDTLYNTEIFDDINQNIDILFLPVNGVGNNMNSTDAENFAKKIKAKHVVPLHFNMFDKFDVKNNFKCDGTVIPKIYKEIVL